MLYYYYYYVNRCEIFLMVILLARSRFDRLCFGQNIHGLCSALEIEPRNERVL